MKNLRMAVLGIFFIYALFLAVYLQLRLIFGDSLWWMALLNLFAPYYFIPLLITLPLSLLLRQWYIAAVKVVLLLIVVIWVGPLFMPRAAVSAQASPLTLVTVNIAPENRSPEEALAWLTLQDTDLIFLQDTGRGRVRDAFALISTDAYPYQAEVAEGNGLLIFSRYQLTEIEAIDLDEDAEPDGQRAVLDVDGSLVALYNLHLANPVGSGQRLNIRALPDFVQRYDDSQRNQQIDNLLTRLRLERLPFIVVGDFNMGSFAARYADLQSVMVDAFIKQGQGFGPTWSAFPLRGSSERMPLILRLDYVWHSPDLESVSFEIGPEIGSDHLPLKAAISISPSSG